MNNNLYSRLQCALRDSNVDSLKRLYDENPDNLEIKFEYAKRLKLYDLNFSKQLLLELVNDRRFKNKYAAFIQLGIIERRMGNYNISRKYFQDILDSNESNEIDKEYAKYEIGRLEEKIGNVDEALRLFNELKDSSIWFYSYTEIGIIEFKRNNNDKARECFEKLLDSKCSLLAKLWLGKLEASEGRYLQAMLYLNELKNTTYGREASMLIEDIRKMQSNEHIRRR